MRQEFPPQPKRRYLEFAGREFEYVVVHPWPRDSRGRVCRCHVDLAKQLIEVGGNVPMDDREALVRETMQQALGFKGVRLVPVLASVS